MSAKKDQLNQKICPECGKEFDPSVDDFNAVKCFSCNFDSASETAYPEEHERPKMASKWLKIKKKILDLIKKI